MFLSKKENTGPADGLKAFYSPVQLSESNSRPGISSMRLRLRCRGNLLVMTCIDGLPVQHLARSVHFF